MTTFWRAVLTIAWKDLLLELRTKEIVSSLLVFALLVAVVFNFAIDPLPELVALALPGMLWIAFVFAGILGLNRTYVREKDRESLTGLMLSPVGRDAIYFGKLLGILVFMLIVEVLMYPVFAVLFGLPLFMPRLLVIAFPATLGFAAVGTIFSAMAVHTRSREVMLPLLFFPIALPIIVAAVESSAGVLEGAGWASMSRWLQLMGVFDILFLVVSSFAFEYVLEE